MSSAARGTSIDRRAARALRRLGTSPSPGYRIVRLLGVGGMAAVYEAATRDGDRVALKVLHEALSDDPKAEALFRREARLARAVAHANVVPVIDEGVSDDGCTFLVMPLVRGETLKQRAERAGGRLPIAEVVVIADGALEALAAAHAARVVHRDLKPSNVMLTEAGAIVLLDFGVARFLDREAHATSTASGVVIGTPAFMAPEQALGRASLVDARTDVWGIGATLFKLASGRYVHDAEGWAGGDARSASVGAPPLAAVAPEVPRALCDVIDRALAFEPDARWSDARAMQAALVAASIAALGCAPTELPRLAPRAAEEEDASVTLRPPSDARDGSARALALSLAPGTRLAQRWRAPVAKVVALGVAAGIVATGSALRRGGAAAAASAAASASASASASAAAAASRGDLVGPGDDDVPREAVEEFRAAVQLWRDASFDLAAARLDAATARAPGFAAAHLWAVLASPYASDGTRAHYAAAAAHRAALSPIAAEVLEAVRPATDDPPDYASAARALGEVGARHPEAFAIAITRARLFVRMSDAASAEAALAQVPADAASLGVTWLSRAAIASLAADDARALDALERCVDASPSGTSCLTHLWEGLAADGRCDALEPVCRKLATRAPASPAGYECLADALASTGAGADAVRGAYAERYARMDAGDVAASRAEDDTWLAVVAGDLDGARAGAAAWVDHATRASASTATRASAAEALVALDLETGRRAEAVTAARAFVAGARAWPRTSVVDLDATGIFLRSETGDLGATERAPLRARVIEASEAPSYGPALRRWYDGYAATSWTRAEAQEAIAHAPDLPPAAASDDDYLFARVFALAGDDARAEAHLARATRTCAVRDDFYRTKAKLELALRREADRGEACALYRAIGAHWPASISITARRAAARAQALGCGSRDERGGKKEGTR